VAPDRTERKLAAILSADVVGYSRLMADDEAATVEAVKATWELCERLILQHGGRLVDAVGDNLLADFPSVVDAVACGVLAQQELGGRNAELTEQRRMLLRIGINLGDVLIDEERIYGDGVNIAARVQALAEPGGVAISRAAFDQVEEKLELEFEDLGEHAVKNIPKPIRVYRVAVSEGREGPAARALPGFSGRPAIAVLPFDNLSADAEQDYFADGLAEDLITRLSQARGFSVIARASSFIYRGRGVDLAQVGRELGARYVVLGSVRRAGSRVRVSAQLAEARRAHAGHRLGDRAASSTRRTTAGATPGSKRHRRVGRGAARNLAPLPPDTRRLGSSGGAAASRNRARSAARIGLGQPGQLPLPGALLRVGQRFGSAHGRGDAAGATGGSGGRGGPDGPVRARLGLPVPR
jgi:class 3 adenylate cyclase